MSTLGSKLGARGMLRASPSLCLLCLVAAAGISLLSPTVAQRSHSLVEPPEYVLPRHPPAASKTFDRFVQPPLGDYSDLASPPSPGNFLEMNADFAETALPAFIEWPYAQSPFFQQQDFTWEVWVRPSAEQELGSCVFGNLFQQGDAASGYGLRLNAKFEGSDGKTYLGFTFVVADGGVITPSETERFPGGAIASEEWNHIACSYSPEQGARLYINGQLVDQRPTGGGPLPEIEYVYDNKFRVGAYVDNITSLMYKGGVDELRFWSPARTSEEIFRLRDQRLAGDEDGMLAYFPCDDGQGTTLTDSVFGEDTHPGLFIGRHPDVRWRSSDYEWRMQPEEGAGEALKLPTGLADNLVLLPNAVPCETIWGWAVPSEVVRVAFHGYVYNGIADHESGKWSVCVDTTHLLGGPFNITITSNGVKKTLTNVFVGTSATTCHNDAQHVVTSVYPCEVFTYPDRWLPSASLYLPFDNCDNPETDRSSVANDVVLTGSCLLAGFRSSAWLFKNHFLIVDGVGGFFGGAFSFSLWFRREAFETQTQGAMNGTRSQLMSKTHLIGLGRRGSGDSSALILTSDCNNNSSAGNSSSNTLPQLALLVDQTNSSSISEYLHCTGVAIPSSVWVHTVLTFDGDKSFSVYANGILRRRAVFNSTRSMFRQVLMGRGAVDRRSSSQYAADEVWMLPWALTAEEVRDIMNYGPRFTESQSDGTGNKDARFLDGLSDAQSSGMVSDIILETDKMLNYRSVNASFNADRAGSGWLQRVQRPRLSCGEQGAGFVVSEGNTGDMAASTCISSCDCCGARTCSPFGWCMGNSTNAECG